MQKKKILLADDVELFLELEKTFFRREGFDLLVARSGEEAYRMVLDHRPDMVFMDLFMPQMNGDEACRKIKEDAELRSIPVVMVTHGGKDDDLDRCRDAGCDDLVLKPINRHHFLTTARRFLGIVDRAAHRVRARFKVSYGMPSKKISSTFSVNLSTGGLFIETEEAFPPDSRLQLEFRLPDREAPVTCGGRVAWVNHPRKIVKAQLPPGLGLQFMDLRLEDMEAIRNYIKGECLDGGQSL